ncbi:hypothetical protein Tco_0123826 [Tanacetum coccineum]
MGTRYFMKHVNNDNYTNANGSFENHDYHEGRHYDKKYLCVTNLKQPFIQSKCFPLVNNLPSTIYPCHTLEFYARYYFGIPILTLHFHMYGYGYAWDLRKLGWVLNVSFNEPCIPLKSWEKNQLHPHLKAWAGVLLINVFVKIEAQESLAISVGHMLYCIKTSAPFNFAYFIARRLSGLDYNNEALPYDRVMITLIEYLKNKHPNDASRMIKV